MQKILFLCALLAAIVAACEWAGTDRRSRLWKRRRGADDGEAGYAMQG
jgi:hypothetical protein